MPQCNTCQAELDDAALAEGHCSMCGAPITSHAPRTSQDEGDIQLAELSSDDFFEVDTDPNEESLDLLDVDPGATIDLSPSDTAEDLPHSEGSDEPPISAQPTIADDEPGDESDLYRRAAPPLIRRRAARVRLQHQRDGRRQGSRQMDCKRGNT